MYTTEITSQLDSHEWIDWFGSLLVRDEACDEAPWHVEQLLIGEQVEIDMTRVGGACGLYEVTDRKICGNQLKLTVEPVVLPREYPLA